MIEWQEASGEGLIRLRVGQYEERGVGERRVGQTQEANAAQVRSVRQMRQVTAQERRHCSSRDIATGGGTRSAVGSATKMTLAPCSAPGDCKE